MSARICRSSEALILLCCDIVQLGGTMVTNERKKDREVFVFIVIHHALWRLRLNHPLFLTKAQLQPAATFRNRRMS